MKLVILAGGLGSRLSEETHIVPKPMVKIGDSPILWHIMKYYSGFGIDEFVVCLGYKGYVIKEYFANYALHRSDVTLDMSEGITNIHNSYVEPWKVSLIETGPKTLTGGRIKRIKEYIGNETFLMTYGDGLSDIDIKEEISFHKSHGRYATVSAVQPPGRFGALVINDDNNSIESFEEKPRGDDSWINGGFFVLEPEIFDFIEGDQTTWEQEPMKDLALQGQLVAKKHSGFWAAMDTLREKRQLEEKWNSGNPPWKNWE